MTVMTIGILSIVYIALDSIQKKDEKEMEEARK